MQLFSPERRNDLLNSLATPDQERMRPLLTPVTFEPRQVLMRAGESIEFVYFPWAGVCSVVANMADGGAVEIATVGREGVVGYLAGFGEQLSAHDCMLQIPAADAGAYRMSVRDFRDEMSHPHDLRRAIALRKANQLTIQCNSHTWGFQVILNARAQRRQGARKSNST